MVSGKLPSFRKRVWTVFRETRRAEGARAAAGRGCALSRRGSGHCGAQQGSPGPRGSAACPGGEKGRDRAPAGSGLPGRVAWAGLRNPSAVGRELRQPLADETAPVGKTGLGTGRDVLSAQAGRGHQALSFQGIRPAGSSALTLGAGASRCQPPGRKRTLCYQGMWGRRAQGALLHVGRGRPPFCHDDEQALPDIRA